MTTPPRKVISGGQTGADRAALDWAMGRGLETGGWCPAGRLAEDGVIPLLYPLKETTESAHIVRTEANVRDADATVIFSLSSRLVGGSSATRDLAVRIGRPWLHLARDAMGSVDAGARTLAGFVDRHAPRTLNIAGSRASEEPGIGDFVAAVLERAFPQPTRP